MSDDNGSYDPSDTNAPSTVPIDVFQVEMRAAFEQLCITQDAHVGQLAKILESSRCYANELAHQRASID